MKGVLLSRCPDARLVDISHEIPAFSILPAAYAIDQAAPFFPPGTVHQIVVDPGVGTSRKPILAQALGQLFVAPDNGVLSMIMARDRAATVRELSNRDLWLDSPSSTFHGRDVFAPVTAALASGVARPEDVGPPLKAIVLLSGLEAAEKAPGSWEGMVLSVDHFGNIISNFRMGTIPQLTPGKFSLRIGNREISDLQKAFADAPQGDCFAYFGSSGYMEIGMNQQSAAAALNAAPGMPIRLTVWN